MSKLVAVEGVTLTITPPGTVEILPASLISQVVSAEGKKAYHTIAFTATIGAYVGGGVITGSSEKAKSKTLSFVLEGDSVDVVLTQPPPGQPSTQNATVSVLTAGQTSLRVK